MTDKEETKRLFEYCKSKEQKCYECVFYDKDIYRCSLGPAIMRMRNETESVPHCEADIIQCVTDLHEHCKRHKQGERCPNCEFEYAEFGLYRCKLGNSVEGFDNPSSWGFAKNLKANSLF